ncbi:hypothetical protein [Telmatospirillum sp.]|uniref:hypothetical protein n=1 Tax=Telmatospirillum sp. TaxID=2079197 RepID=UPI00283F13F1|nr:hypothetical protein [Telmatospirillum sp.]MDR3436344.1 hypothetical protein [Telmatospirillum sp.]
MSGDPLDTFMRSASLPADIADDRVQAMMNGVLARLDQLPPVRRHTAFWRFLSPPLPRYAVQMATAALLGILLGAALPQKEETVQQPPLVSLISASAPSQPLGF